MPCRRGSAGAAASSMRRPSSRNGHRWRLTSAALERRVRARAPPRSARPPRRARPPRASACSTSVTACVPGLPVARRRDEDLDRRVGVAVGEREARVREVDDQPRLAAHRRERRRGRRRSRPRRAAAGRAWRSATARSYGARGAAAVQRLELVEDRAGRRAARPPRPSSARPGARSRSPPGACGPGRRPRSARSRCSAASAGRRSKNAASASAVCAQVVCGIVGQPRRAASSIASCA